MISVAALTFPIVGAVVAFISQSWRLHDDRRRSAQTFVGKREIEEEWSQPKEFPVRRHLFCHRLRYYELYIANLEQ